MVLMILKMESQIYLLFLITQRRAAQEKDRQLSPRSREAMVREAASKGIFVEGTVPPHMLQHYGAVPTPQGLLYVPRPGQVASTESSDREPRTSPMPPRDATPPRAEERASSAGWPPHGQPRTAHPQHSPGGAPSQRPGEPVTRGGVIQRSITSGTVIMEPRPAESGSKYPPSSSAPGHVNGSPFDTLVHVAANAAHVSVPGKDARHPQLSPAPRGEPPKDLRASDPVSKVK